jgi:enamine deaminase RidA (YjgF/YER057c/UK114 family)
MRQQAFPAHPAVPISKAVRAGDLVFTSAYGPWTFDPKDVVFDAEGRIVTDGSGLEGMAFDEQVHRTFGFVEAALKAAGAELADVIDCQCWLADARDFVAFNAIYRSYFSHDPPVRSIFPSAFMFLCKVEMKVIAYRPLGDA